VAPVASEAPCELGYMPDTLVLGVESTCLFYLRCLQLFMVPLPLSWSLMLSTAHRGYQ
jgi:hypothetical protein